MNVDIRRGDGSVLRCWTEGAQGPGVVILHAWWGLNGDITALADRLAGEGFRVIAPDLFDGRMASTPEEAQKLADMGDAQWRRLVADVQRAAARIRAHGAEKVGAIGLSFGAPFAVAAAIQNDVDALVLFYGASALEPGEHVEAPVLGHFADDDPYEPDGGKTFFDQLRAAGAQAERHVYPRTRHWFFEPSNPHYDKDAASLAWDRTLAFLGTRLGR